MIILIVRGIAASRCRIVDDGRRGGNKCCASLSSLAKEMSPCAVLPWVWVTLKSERGKIQVPCHVANRWTPEDRGAANVLPLGGRCSLGSKFVLGPPQRTLIHE